MGVGGRSISNEFCYRRRTTSKGVAQRFNDEDACAFAHDEAVTRRIEGARCFAGRVVETGGERSCCSETAEADDVHTGFRSAANRNVSFIGPDEPCGIADRLNACGTCRYRRAKRTFEAMSDGDLSGGEIDKKGWNGEGRKAADAALVDGTHRLRYRGKATDARCDDCRRSQFFFFRSWLPVRLRQSLFRRCQRKDDEAVDLTLILRGQSPVRIKSSFRIFSQGRDHASDF
ncbi:hypothetical protein D3C78_1223660 [compost metagenome]